MSGQARVLNGEVDAGQHKIVHVGELVDDPHNMRCCLDSSVFDFTFRIRYIFVIEFEFPCGVAQCRKLEEGFVLREAVAGYS